jgi:hypothetical protein
MILAAKESYLKSKMDESKKDLLYLRLPDGKLTELKRYQYDLKQAEHEWQFNLTGILEGARCQLSDENPLAFSSTILLHKLHRTLNKNYGEVAVKTCDMLANLRIQVEIASNNSVKISQPECTEKLFTLVKFYENNLKPAETPMRNSERVPRSGEDQSVIAEITLSLIGALNFLAGFIRPDIMYALPRCALKCKKPTKRDFHQVVRIFCYIAGTEGFGSIFSQGSVVLWDYADSSPNSYSDAKGHMGYVFPLREHDLLFRCKSTKMKLTALNSTESEYVALCEAARDAVWLRRFLRDIGFDQLHPTVMFDDNKSCIDMVHEMSNHNASKGSQGKVDGSPPEHRDRDHRYAD